MTAQIRRNEYGFRQIFVTISVTSRTILLSYCQIFVKITKDLMVIGIVVKVIGNHFSNVNGCVILAHERFW